MITSAELRKQVESVLATRFPSALSMRPPTPPELVSCGIGEVDSLLGGGIPVGAITELTGAYSSGRTSLVLSALAEATRRGESCAYVDASDALDPVSAAAAGMDLHRLLWVRSSDLHVGRPSLKARNLSSTAALRSLRASVAETASPSVPATESMVKNKRIGSAGWFHPREENLGLDLAVGKLFQSAPQEQTDFTPRCSESKRRAPLQPVTMTPVKAAPQPVQELSARGGRKNLWTRLDQALRATDLLLNAGGFPVIVLDMGDIAPEQARRVPLATWYRFRLQAEKSRTRFLLITRVPCAHSCAAVSLHFQPGSVDWRQAAPQSPYLLTGVRYRADVERNRNVDPMRKKPVASASWSSWAVEAR